MSVRHLHCQFPADLSLLKQGLVIAEEFGLGAMEELARMGRYLEQNTLEPHSLRRTAGGVAFTLRNPPLRMGAFSAVSVLWDGVRVPAESGVVHVDHDPVGVPFSRIDRAHPITLPVGRRTDYEFAPGSTAAGKHGVRLELQSVAIPPVVWFEFEETLGEPAAQP